MTPAAKRTAVVHLMKAYEMSERRACSVIGADRSSVRYRSLRPDDDALRVRMRELAAERRRFGYRRLHVLLRREGLVRNPKRTQRLYREEGLTVRKRRGRKRAVGTRAPILTLAAPPPVGSPITTSAVRIPRSVTQHQRPMPPNSPQWAIDGALPRRGGDRPLLRRRSRANFTAGLRL